MSLFAPGRRPWSGGRWRATVIWLGTTVLLIGGVVIVGTLFLGQLPRPLPAPASFRAPEPVPGPNHQFTFYPNSSRVAAGIKYVMTMSTHCGIGYPDGPDFDGSLWDPTWTKFGFDSQPEGTKGPADSGYMVLVSGDTAQFHSSKGFTFTFTRHAGPRIAGDCA